MFVHRIEKLDIRYCTRRLNLIFWFEIIPKTTREVRLSRKKRDFETTQITIKSFMLRCLNSFLHIAVADYPSHVRLRRLKLWGPKGETPGALQAKRVCGHGDNRQYMSWGLTFIT